MNIQDNQRLVSARFAHGTPIPVYDDGFGPLWIHRDSMGVSGIVRARTWEDAYSICEDEFFPEADETIEELRKEYGFRRERVKLIGSPTEAHRVAVESDYPLRPDQFIRWETEETPDADAWPENELFQEAFGFRPSGPRTGKRADGSPRDPIGHGIYAKDLNGDALEPLTYRLIHDLNIVVEIETEA
jgi:hypothetical protein